jgi:hypothetical protein
MKKYLLVFALSLSLFTPSAFGDAAAVPHLVATNPAPGEVDLTYVGLPSDAGFVILFQNGFDTMRPDTGTIVLTGVYSQTWVYQVCAPNPRRIACTNPVVLQVQ